MNYYNENDPKPISDDLNGHHYGKLSVSAFAGYEGKEFKHAMWFCKCDCGNNRKVRGTKLVNRLVFSCVVCSRSRGAKQGGIKRCLPTSAFHKIIGMYKSNARKKKLEFNINKKELFILFTGLCVYCGSPPLSLSKTKNGVNTFKYNGIDRVDNGRGYVKNNVVSCCRICNYAKQTMSRKEFLLWVEKTYLYTFKERSNL